MADSMAKLIAKLEVDRRGMQKGLRGGLGDLKSFASKALTIAAPLAAAFSARAIIQASQTQQRAERKLEAVLKATGNAAGFSADEIKRYAGELQALTGVGDEVTISAAGVLGTFTKVQGAVFKDAIRLGQDMAAVFEQDMKGSLTQLGKALNDPIRGITALSRTGVSFTEQQKEQIRVLQESGDLLGAQKIIISELEAEFGGAAENMMDPIGALTGIVGDMAESLGFLSLDTVQGITKELGEFFGVVIGDQKDFQNMGKTLASVIVPAFEAWLNVLKALTPLMERTAGFSEKLAELAESPDKVRTGVGNAVAGAANSRIAKGISTGLASLPGGAFAEQFRQMFGGTAAAIAAPRAPRPAEETIRSVMPETGPSADTANAIFGAVGAASSLGDLLSEAAKDFVEGIAQALPEVEEWGKNQREALQTELDELFQKTRTPLERFQAEAARLQKLLDLDLIDQQLFDRALLQAGDGLDLGVDRDAGPIRGVGAVDARSTEAFSVIQAAIRNGQSGQRDPVKIQQEMLKELKKIASKEPVEIQEEDI